MRGLTKEEERVLQLLGEAAHEYGQLPHVHPNDSWDFIHAIHMAQNVVLARPQVPEEKAEHPPQRPPYGSPFTSGTTETLP